jgi:hypothetical protein
VLVALERRLEQEARVVLILCFLPLPLLAVVQEVLLATALTLMV